MWWSWGRENWPKQASGEREERKLAEFPLTQNVIFVLSFNFSIFSAHSFIHSHFGEGKEREIEEKYRGKKREGRTDLWILVQKWVLNVTFSSSLSPSLSIHRSLSNHPHPLQALHLISLSPIFPRPSRALSLSFHSSSSPRISVSAPLFFPQLLITINNLGSLLKANILDSRWDVKREEKEQMDRWMEKVLV